MPLSVKDLHECELGGRKYLFRTPTAHDLPKIRRVLTQQGIRRPLTIEFRVAALAGLDALGETAGDTAEAERQKGVVERWHELMPAIDEDEIDEPDFEKRAELVRAAEEEREAERRSIFGQYLAIEANLARHWPPYRDLLADRQYWDDVSAVETVRLLLAAIDGGELPRSADGMLTHEAYLAIPAGARAALAAFAQHLLVPTETERKN